MATSDRDEKQVPRRAMAAGNAVGACSLGAAASGPAHAPRAAPSARGAAAAPAGTAGARGHAHRRRRGGGRGRRQGAVWRRAQAARLRHRGERHYSFMPPAGDGEAPGRGLESALKAQRPNKCFKSIKPFLLTNDFGIFIARANAESGSAAAARTRNAERNRSSEGSV